ncbi:MAG: energy transducer TonB [Desulfosudaceae bacterium]
MAQEKKKPNRVLQIMIVISLAVHVLIFAHIADIYHSESLTYIELAMRDISKPSGRAIPRPRSRPENPKVHEAEQLNIARPNVPPAAADNFNDPAPESLTENISVPDFSGDAAASDWQADGSPVFATTRDYFDMVRMKIESHKKYPSRARQKQFQGRVRIRFLITPDGQVSSLKITKRSPHEILDRAALEAVRKAAPLPRPPTNLFAEEKKITVEITVMFELT